MTEVLLSRWLRSARALRLGDVGSIHSSSSSSSSRKISTSTILSHKLPIRKKIGAVHDRDPAGEPPTPTLYSGSGELFNDRDLDTGAEIAAFCRQQKISPAHHMRSIRMSQTKVRGITVQVSPHHCFDSNHMKYMDKVEHPMRKTIFDLYASWADRPLWYSGGAFMAAPIVNSKAKRWIQKGIREALLARGYDRDGRKKKTWSAEKTGTRDGKASPAALYGTLKVIAHQPQAFCQLSFPEVLELMKEVLAAAEPSLLSVSKGQSFSEARYHGKQNNPRQGNSDSAKSHQAFKKAPIKESGPGPRRFPSKQR